MRGMFANALTESGIAPGALLQVQIGGGWNSEPYDEIYMVRDVNLNNVVSRNSWSNQSSISLVKLKNFKSRRNMALTSVPMTESFAFMGRHHDESARWESGPEKGIFVAEDRLCRVIKPCHKTIDYNCGLTDDTKVRFNFKPSTYREEDKWRVNVKMKAVENFLEKYGD